MTQAAKAQEPSMEEILASIRRIIADDDGVKKPEIKPEAKAEPPAVKAPAPPPPKPAPAPPPAMKQDDIDAMLAGLDEPAAELAPPPRAPEPDVLELTEAMQAPATPAFRKIDAQQDVVFDEAPDAEPAPSPPPPRAADPPRAALPPPRAPAMAEPDIISSATAAAVELGVQCAGAHRAGAERQDAGRSREGDAAPDAAALARQQSADAGRTAGAAGDRARRTRARLDFLAHDLIRKPVPTFRDHARSRLRSRAANQYPNTGNSKAAIMKIGGPPVRSISREPPSTPSD